MDDLLKKVDIREMGHRLALVRRHLDLTQQEVALEIGTKQNIISKIERGEQLLSPIFLRLLLFYSRSVSMDYLFGSSFTLDGDSLEKKDYALQTVVKKRMEMLCDSIQNSLERESRAITDEIKDAARLL